VGRAANAAFGLAVKPLKSPITSSRIGP